MKISIIFILWVSLSLMLIFFCNLMYAKPIHLQRLEDIRIAKIQKVCMKEHPKKRDHHETERSFARGQMKINALLKQHPIVFENRSHSLEQNNSNHFTLNTNKVTLARLLDVLNNLNEVLALSIHVHTDENESSQYNLKLSQNRADVLKHYIQERSHMILVTSVGYGKELPRSGVDENLSNRRIEIRLKRVQ